MIRCKLVVCGEVALLDKSTNNSSVVNILQQMTVGGFPFIVQKLGCLFMLERDEEDPATPNTSIQITINDDELNTIPFAIDFEDKLRATAIVRIQGVVLPRPGTAAVRLLLEGEEAGRWEFEIRQINEPEVEVEQG